MTVRIAIDPNVCVQGWDGTYSGFEAVRPLGAPLAVGDPVLALEPIDGIVTDATVTGVDPEKKLVYLAVDWRGWRDDPEAADDPARE